MSKLAITLIILGSLLAGFGGGWIYELTLGKDKTTTVNTTAETTTTAATTSTDTAAKEQTLEECLIEVWGTDKYAAITANPSLATDEDNLASLKCYK